MRAIHRKMDSHTPGMQDRSIFLEDRPMTTVRRCSLNQALMNKRVIGDREVGAIGLGCMGMSFAYGQGDDVESQKVLHRALELGVDHWDTADMYGQGKNELLLASVLKDVRDQVFLATKFGNVFDRTLTSHQDQVAANVPVIVDGTPGYARKSLENSLKRLGVDHIDLYYLHRIDPLIPVEETVGAMAEFVKEGKVRALGISEASASTIRRAHQTHPIAAVQNELSLWTRDFETSVIPVCEELGIAFVAYSPLGRGFLTGEIKSFDDLPADDWRRLNPRFQPDNFAKNLQIVDRVKEIADKHGAKPGQVALAWAMSLSERIVPIPGTKRVRYLDENAAADSLMLTAEELSELSSIVPPEGDRYPTGTMRFVNA